MLTGRHHHHHHHAHGAAARVWGWVNPAPGSKPAAAERPAGFLFVWKPASNTRSAAKRRKIAAQGV